MYFLCENIIWSGNLILKIRFRSEMSKLEDKADIANNPYLMVRSRSEYYTSMSVSGLPTFFISVKNMNLLSSSIYKHLKTIKVISIIFPRWHNLFHKNKCMLISKGDNSAEKLHNEKLHNPTSDFSIFDCLHYRLSYICHYGFKAYSYPNILIHLANWTIYVSIIK
jgi:hypothetical protein